MTKICDRMEGLRVPDPRVLHYSADSHFEDKLEQSFPQVDQGAQHSRSQHWMQYSFDIDLKSPSCVVFTCELQIHHARYMPGPDLGCHFSSSHCLSSNTAITTATASGNCLSWQTCDRLLHPYRGIAKEVLHCRPSRRRMT